MRDELPAIVKLAMRACVAIEEAVTRFPRRHKYGLGADLRSGALRVDVAAHFDQVKP